VEWKLFDRVPDWVTPEWHATREAAHHIDEPWQAMRMLISRAFVEYLHRFHNVRALLDLGCGDGGFLESLNHLTGLTRTGVDLSPKAVQWAVEQRGVNASLLDFIGKKEEIAAADCTVLTEVLEHLCDPHGLLRFLAESKKAKYIVASSPINETQENHYEFHLWAWDNDGYNALLTGNGWAVLKKVVIDGFQVVIARNVFADVIPETLAIAVENHRSGRFQAAEQNYRQILAIDPNHADATHLLGVLAAQAGQHQVALGYIDRAIALAPRAAAFHFNRGAVLQQLRRLDEAAASYRQSLQLKPDYAEASDRLSAIQKEQGQPES
jgi:predicted TPR repeat methyltransferase